MRNLKRALSLTLASVMLLGMMVVGSSAASFPDVDENDNIEAIDVLETVKVMVGNENGDFQPDKDVTRAEMAVVMAELLNLDYDYYVTTCPFNDVPQWAKGYVGACAANGIVSGRGEGVYDPSATVTAVEAASMMMRALGYFQNSGDYKPNFESATVKQASEISLFDGINSNAKTPLNRNQVAKLALNALEANMVTFTGDAGFELNGVNVGYRSEYTFRTGSEKKYAALSDLGDTVAVGGNRGQYYVQLGEELYDGKLTKRSGPAYPDDFGRPATTWRYDGKDIGTYADEADATYTKAVEIGDIYKDLGLGSTVKAENVTVYVDGVEDDNQPARSIRKGDSNKYGANGVLTEVFYLKSNRTDEENTIVITEINTYTGEVSKTVAATDKKDAYVVVVPESNVVKNGNTIYRRPENVSGNLNFETDAAFEDDARVLYTYSRDSKEVKSLAVAESTSGEASRADNSAVNEDQNKAIYIEDTAYKFSAKNAGVDLGEVSVGSSYDVYLDAYGYAIFVEEIEEIGDYALVLGARGKDSFSSNRALLVFADGTEKIVDTDKNYNPSDDTVSSNNNKNAIYPGTIVTYRVDDGVYTLKPVSKTVATDVISKDGLTFSGGTDTKFLLLNDKAGVVFTTAAADSQNYYEYVARTTAGSQAKSAPVVVDARAKPAKTVNANSSTIFVVYDMEDDTYTTYTGIKNAPKIYATDAAGKPTGAGGVHAYAYCKGDSTMAKVMFIFAEETESIVDGNNNLLFLAKESVSDLIHDKTGDYFIYNAVAGSEITTVKVDEALGKNLNGLYKSYTMNKHGIITGVTKYDTFTNADDTKKALDGVAGIAKRSADYTVIMGPNKYTVTVDDNPHIYAVDEDGVITESSYRAISEDADDKVYAVVDGWLVKDLFIKAVNNKDNAQAATVTITSDKNDPAVGDDVTLTANVTLHDEDNDVITKYEWYKSTSDFADLAALEAGTKTKLNSTKDTCTEFDTTAKKTATEVYYYCVVTTRNDEVEGKDTAQAMAKFNCAVSAVPGEQVWVRVQFQTGALTGDDGIVDAVSLQVEVDGAKYGKLTANDLAGKIPTGYKIADTGSGLPANVEPSTTTQLIKVKVELKSVKTVEILDEPAGDFWLKYKTDAANVPAQVKEAGMTVKVTFTDDTNVTVDADDGILSWTATPTADGNAKVTCNTVDSANLAFKVYADVAGVTADAATLGDWTVTVASGATTKTGKVTLTFTQKAGNTFNESAMNTLVGKLANNSTTTATVGTFSNASLTRGGAAAGTGPAVAAVFTVEVAVTSPSNANVTLLIKSN